MAKKLVLERKAPAAKRASGGSKKAEPAKRGKRLNKERLLELARQLRGVKDQQNTLKKRYDALRDESLEMIETFGHKDDKGHFVLDLPEEVEGITSLIKQRRASTSIVEPLLLDLLQSRDVVTDDEGQPERAGKGEGDLSLYEYCSNGHVIIPGVSQEDLAAIVQYAKKKGYASATYDRAVDMDIVLDSVYRGIISEKEMEGCVEEKVTWSLVEGKA